MVSGDTHACSSKTLSQTQLTLSMMDSILLFSKTPAWDRVKHTVRLECRSTYKLKTRTLSIVLLTSRRSYPHGHGTGEHGLRLHIRMMASLGTGPSSTKICQYSFCKNSLACHVSWLHSQLAHVLPVATSIFSFLCFPPDFSVHMGFICRGHPKFSIGAPGLR